MHDSATVNLLAKLLCTVDVPYLSSTVDGGI